MIGLDTNILVRYLVNDDATQYEQATAVIDQAAADQEPCFISIATLLETLWVLRGTYKVSRADILRTVSALIASDLIVLMDEELVAAAVDISRTHNCDLPDALIAEMGRHAGCRHTLTFDKKASSIPGMCLVEPVR